MKFKPGDFICCKTDRGHFFIYEGDKVKESQYYTTFNYSVALEYDDRHYMKLRDGTWGYGKMLKLNGRVTSVDVPGAKDIDNPLIETISDAKRLGHDEQLQEDCIKRSITNCVFELPEKQREVICRRYGICGYEEATLEQVAQELEVTRERVRQIQMEGLKKLKEILQNHGFSFDSVFNQQRSFAMANPCD